MVDVTGTGLLKKGVSPAESHYALCENEGYTLVRVKIKMSEYKSKDILNLKYEI